MFVGTPAGLAIGPAPADSEIGSCSPDIGAPLNLPIEFDSTYLISLRENSAGIRNVDASESDSFIPMRRIQ